MNDGNDVLREVRKEGFYIPRRYVLAVLAFFGLFNVSCMRSNINVTILAMINTTQDNITQTGLFNWNSKQQGILIGSYYYGYAAANIPGGILASKFGFRNLCAITMLVASVLTLTFPLVAYYNFYFAVACRATLGLFQGGTVPALNYAWSNWAPPLEVSILNSIGLSGIIFGQLVVYPLAGVIAHNVGWEATYYITGGMTLIWLIFFLIFASDTPSSNKWISKTERAFIEKSIGKRELSDEPKLIPWKAIFSSKCIWALFATHSADAWFQYTFAAILPTYMAEVFHYDITQSGLVMILPFLTQWIVLVLASQTTDLLRKKKIVTTTRIRKINTLTSCLVSGVLPVLSGYTGRDRFAVISLFTISFAIGGLHYPGYLSTALDVAPRYSGIVFGISNTMANTMGFLGPFAAGYMITDQQSVALWENLFWLTFGINLTGGLIFAIFGSGVEQTWAKKDYKEIFCRETEKLHQTT
ncbi:unnamed protein product [Clavelina lepadiformis]|uniref:Major facilitator superfamily (MFS) profile domain-containing protein n=1 Tax=Clavelina lepadiformis TaxID=159417 RepID=A0ABP0EXL6_CLALP